MRAIGNLSVGKKFKKATRLFSSLKGYGESTHILPMSWEAELEEPETLLTTTVDVCAVQKALCFIQIVVFNTRLALLLYSYIQSIGINFYCRYLF